MSSLLYPYISSKKTRLGKLKARYYILCGRKFEYNSASDFSDIREVYEYSAALSAMYANAASASKRDISLMCRTFSSEESLFCSRILNYVEHHI